MLARIHAVEERLFGSELAAALVGAETSLTVEDPIDFDEEGGSLIVDDEVLAYTTANDETGEIELDGAVVDAHDAEASVYVYPLTLERTAHVVMSDHEDAGDTVEARVPHSLYDRIPTGIRTDINDQETVNVEFEGDELVITDLTGQPPLVDASYIDPATQLPGDFILTDGFAPSVSPTPTVAGGLDFLAVTWPGISNADSVTYEIHVSTVSDFTPDSSTLVGETQATLFFVRNAEAGGALAYDVTYYVKIVARDEDGSAPAGTQGSSQLDPEGTSDILVGSIKAEFLEAVMILGTEIILGNHPNTAIHITPDDIHAHYGEDITFQVDGQTGQVYVRGTLDFGTGSRLLNSDIIEIAEQPTGGFQVPTRVQRVSNRGASGTGTCPWQKATTQGSLLVMRIDVYDSDGTPPSPTTPSGWTLWGTATIDRMHRRIYTIANASSRSGTESVTLNDTVNWCMELLEYSGAEVLDVTQQSSGTSATASTGTTAATTQAEALALAFFAANGDPPGGAPAFDQPSLTSGWTSLGANADTVVGTPVLRTLTAERVLNATGAQEATVDLGASAEWTGTVLVFKAKAAAVDTPETGKARLYSRDVGGEAILHVMQEDAVEGAVVLGKAGEKWRLEIISATIDPPNIGPDAGASTTETVSDLAVGDRILAMYDSTGLGSSYAYRADHVVAVANQVAVRWYKSGAATNPGSQTFYFLVLHRS